MHQRIHHIGIFGDEIGGGANVGPNRSLDDEGVGVNRTLLVKPVVDVREEGVEA